MPFTYFLVQKVHRGENFDQVWMEEMPSPNSFNKNVVLWVDDIPINNIQTITKLEDDNYEVIQLTSTKMAELWAK